MIKQIVITITFLINLLYADYTAIKIKEFINVVSTQNKVNIVIDKDIDVSLDFYINQEIGQNTNLDVLRDVLANNGYMLEHKKDYYLVKKEDEILINKMDIFHLDHANTNTAAANVEKILKSYFESKKVIKQTGVKNQTTPYQENKGNDKVTSESTEVSERLNFSVTPIDNKSIAITYKDPFVPQVVNSILRAIDIEPKRLEIRARIYEVNTKALKEIGTKWGLKYNDGVTNIDADSHNIMLSAAPGKTEEQSYIPLSVSGVIRALEESGNAEIMANPKIMIYEGGKAYLNDGKSYPVSTENTTVQNNQTTTSKNYQNVDTGITMQLEFKEYRAGNVYLSMLLKIDNVEDYNTNDSQIITSKRELRADLKFKPGNEIDLAGLSRQVKSTGSSGIPLLKDIPWIGSLFQMQSDNESATMVIIQLVGDLI